MPLLILIADDDPGVRLAVKDYLELYSYSVITARNGQEALSLLGAYRPHLFISDIKMPQKDGYTLVRYLRQLPEFRLLPVIFLTERDSTGERIQGYEVGCDVYLPKPFEMEELRAVVRNLLERTQIIQSEWDFSKRKFSGNQKNDYYQETAANNQDIPNYIHFTPREVQVLNLLTTGLSNGDIGQKLHLSPRTVEKHVSSLLRKTETNNRAELVRFALDHHLIDS
ncbi:MAG: response regulator [cyanobacterium endosymbiont of Rhopalodia musculus]|uniref:response regulator transcription factor n=1 Tax=cyanobacterium endosymbiont of Epithemia clementina EcSB TaxID=3034674 RepID=UPI00248021E3|nr:response regulator transcription factor [cyanobacterium endosymbiont of Epithemia clementina EcSB]WGT67033.1 response regulator transcription factor [cyanobacterium endosymbiont of Epithemia clementina EcSB]